MNLSTIEQGEELLKRVSRGPWSFERNLRMETYNIESAVPSEYVVWKGYESDGGVCFKEDAEFICWARNHASELLQCAREVEGLKARIEVLENPLPTQEEEREFYHRAYHVCHTGCPMPCPNRT